MLSNNFSFLQQWQDFTPRWARVTFRQMMFYGVHLGHTIRASNPYGAWMVAGLRQGLFLIDLFKFTYQLRMGLFAVEGVVRRKAPFWFVHPQMAAPAFLQESAHRCGEYLIHFPWLGGLLTNHRILRRSIHLLLLRTDAGRRVRQRRLWEANFCFPRWRFSRSTWPRTIFVTSARLGLKPCHEAQCLGLPALTITDTNSAASLVSVAIPANDESVTALWFYVNLVSLFILHRKFGWLNRFLWSSRRRQTRRRRVTLATAATLFASKNLWRRYALRRIVHGKAFSPVVALEPHLWSASLSFLAPWSAPWNFCYRRTKRWFTKAAVASRTPPYHRYSLLKPRIQRALMGAFGKERTFQRLLRLRGTYRSRPLWVFYQTFSSFLLAFGLRWLNLTGPGFRRLFRRFPQDRRRRISFVRPRPKRSRRRRLQRLRHPWTQFRFWHLNIESAKYPEPFQLRRWTLRPSVIRPSPEALQISRYVCRQFFATWFIHQA